MRVIILFILVFTFEPLNAQFFREKNQQLFLYGTEEEYGIVPAGSDGMIIYHEIPDQASFSTRKWEIVYLNADLELQQSAYFESEIGFIITHVKYYHGYVYLLFQDLNIPMRSVFFARAHISSDTFEFFEITEFLPEEVVGFEILGNSLFLIGLDNHRPAILKFKYGDMRPQVLQGLYNENNELLNVSVLHGQEVIQIITRLTKRQGKRSVLLIKQFNENAEIIKDLLIESSKGYQLIDGIANTDTDGNLCVVGTFSYNKSLMSNGVFTVIFDNIGEHSIYYYAYTNLHNYFNYLPEKELQRVKNKYGLGDEHHKKSTYKENQAVRELQKTPSGWMYIGEIIKVKERNSRIYGNLWPMEYRQFSHAIILGIGNEGKLTWDNSFDMSAYVTNSSLQQVYMRHSAIGRALLFFQHGPFINFKILEGDKNISEGIYEIDEQNDEPNMRDIRNYGSILPWYDNYFITFSSHSVDGKMKNAKQILLLTKFSVDRDF